MGLRENIRAKIRAKLREEADRNLSTAGDLSIGEKQVPITIPSHLYLMPRRASRTHYPKDAHAFSARVLSERVELHARVSEQIKPDVASSTSIPNNAEPFATSIRTAEVEILAANPILAGLDFFPQRRRAATSPTEFGVKTKLVALCIAAPQLRIPSFSFSSLLRLRAFKPSFERPALHRFSFGLLDRQRTLFLEQEDRTQHGARLRLPKLHDLPPRPIVKTDNLAERLRQILTPPFQELVAQLVLPERPYDFQLKGIKWLYDRPNALLADEMGLGKTMQAIIAARMLWREGAIQRLLIVCPKSLIPNWREELGKWWPGIDWHVRIAGSGDRRGFLRLATRDVVVKIINYESLRTELDWLKEQQLLHDLVIIDEAQRIKNYDSDTARSVKALKSHRRWALTGTPLENRVADLVSIFEFVRPGLIGRKADDEHVRKAMAPYFRRNKQEEVLPDLPEISSRDVPLELTERQRAVYDRLEQSGELELNARGDSITITHVFALINKLRQVCNFDPESGESSKAEAFLEDLEEIVASGRKSLVFFQFVQESGLRKLAALIQEKGYTPLEYHGEISSRQRELIVETFNKHPARPALLLNYTVGGVGLNLQAANYVFLFDRWWNPAVEDQAIKRAHRLGQRHKVLVKRFYCKNTIEERILLKLKNKRRLFSHIIDENRPAESMGLSDEEIFSLFNLTVRPRRPTRPAVRPTQFLDNLDYRAFEELVRLIYEREGFEVESTGGSHDGGVDLLAHRVSGGARERIVVQCKHQKDSVGRPVVQQLWGVVNADPSVTLGVLVTSAPSFTVHAHDFAAGKRLRLINREDLIGWSRTNNVADLQ